MSDLANNVSKKSAIPDENTCAIHTIAFVIDRSVEDVWEVAHKYWVKTGKGGIISHDKASILKEFGYVMNFRHDLTYEKDRNGISVKLRRLGKTLTLLNEQPIEDAFMVSVFGHVIGVKGGDVLDTDQKRDSVQVNMVYQVVKF